MRYSYRIMPDEEAKAFLQNMRWFSGLGNVRIVPLSNGMSKVRASASAWSYWVEVK
jgi:hypothetical protein